MTDDDSEAVVVMVSKAGSESADMGALERMRGVVESIRPTDPAQEDRAWERLDSLTKPPRSLGMLETLAARVARVQATDRPNVDEKVVLLMAGDHGVVEEGVTPYPQDVTWQMVANFTAGGAAINAITDSVGARVVVTDVGVARDLDGMPGVAHRKVAPGTANMAKGPAMSAEQCAEAVLVGIETARSAIAGGASLLATGEMGIGNTTAASAITSALTGAEPAAVVGAGTGLSHDLLAHKAGVVARALAVNGVGPDSDPFDVLAAVGGLEIAAMAGVVLGAAAEKVCVVSDGVISGAAALVAVRMCPAAADYLFPSHRSAEPAHAVQLDALGLEPVLTFEMRLGEGTGAALTMGVIDAACRMMSQMATFSDAGVSQS